MEHVFSEAIFEPKFGLEGPHLVAASAGTGKTYNIQNIYVRLVAEKGFRVAQIQVMTFTEAATKELRARVRAVLANMARFLAGDTENIGQDEQERLEMGDNALFIIDTDPEGDKPVRLFHNQGNWMNPAWAR